MPSLEDQQSWTCENFIVELENKTVIAKEKYKIEDALLDLQEDAILLQARWTSAMKSSFAVQLNHLVLLDLICGHCNHSPSLLSSWRLICQAAVSKGINVCFHVFAQKPNGVKAEP